jgi:ABC-2 type transport system permease protein
MAFQRALAYRLEYFVSLVNSFLYIFIFTAVWKTVSEDSPNALGTWTGDGLVSYAIFATITKVTMNRNDQMIPAKIRNGDIIFDLLKPYSYPLSYAFDSLGGAMFQVFAKGIPLLVIASLLYDIEFQFDFLNFLYFLLSFALGYVLYVVVGFVLGSMAFYFTDIFGFYLLYFACTTLFSGAIIPIDLFPPLLQEITVFTPFPYFFYYPVAFLMGKIPGSSLHIWIFYLIQIVSWTLLATLSFQIGRKKMEILGG